MGELEELLTTAKKAELMVIDERLERQEIGRTAASEEKAEAEAMFKRKIDELRNTFAIADPNNVDKRVSGTCRKECRKYSLFIRMSQIISLTT